jgi:hypothetical protein
MLMLHFLLSAAHGALFSSPAGKAGFSPKRAGIPSPMQY